MVGATPSDLDRAQSSIGLLEARGAAPSGQLGTALQRLLAELA
jgi:hypothetical protein